MATIVNNFIFIQHPVWQCAKRARHLVIKTTVAKWMYQTQQQQVNVSDKTTASECIRQKWNGSYRSIGCWQSNILTAENNATTLEVWADRNLMNTRNKADMCNLSLTLIKCKPIPQHFVEDNTVSKTTDILSSDLPKEPTLDCNGIKTLGSQSKLGTVLSWRSQPHLRAFYKTYWVWNSAIQLSL